MSSSDGLTLNEAHRVRDRVQHHAKSEDENGNVRLTNIIWGMSIKPNLAEDEMEVVVVATGFQNDDLARPIVIKIEPEKEVVPTSTAPKVGENVEKEPEVAPLPKYRPTPAPITRPSRNFAEIEECKRTPAYLAHGITLTTAVKAHQVAGVEKEHPNSEPDMPALF